jgi:SAM-dependent methyltransferase
MIEIRHKEMDRSEAIRRAYDDIYTHEGILHRDSFYLWLIDLLKPEAGRTLVDISCGQGQLVILARRRGLIGIGMDFSIDGLKKGYEVLPQAIWAVGDGECLPLADRSTDYVCHIGSLEHYSNLDLGAREIARILKDGGRACILVPNAFGLLGNIRHVLRTGDVFDDGQPLQRYGTRTFWADLLTTNGLKIEKTIGWGEVEFPRNSRDAVRLLKHPQKIVRFILSPLIPLNLVNHFVFLCTRV